MQSAASSDPTLPPDVFAYAGGALVVWRYYDLPDLECCSQTVVVIKRYCEVVWTSAFEDNFH